MVRKETVPNVPFFRLRPSESVSYKIKARNRWEFPWIASRMGNATN